MSKTRFVAFATQKGGIGKSTITALVANYYALVGSIGDVFLCQFLDGSEDGIRAACILLM